MKYCITHLCSSIAYIKIIVEKDFFFLFFVLLSPSDWHYEWFSTVICLSGENVQAKGTLCYHYGIPSGLLVASDGKEILMFSGINQYVVLLHAFYTPEIQSNSSENSMFQVCGHPTHLFMQETDQNS